MKRLLLVSTFVAIYFSVVAQPIKVMLVTGGHDFEAQPFFEMFDAMEGVEYEHYEQPSANHRIAKDYAKDFDVIVFMICGISLV